MTDDKREAPERIWFAPFPSSQEGGHIGEAWDSEGYNSTESVRADTIDALTAERDAQNEKIRSLVEALDSYAGTPCAEIRWAQEKETLAAERDALREALQEGFDLIRGEDVGADWKRGCASFLRKARAALKGET